MGLLFLLNVNLEHLGAEGERLCLLDQLLVGRVCVDAHDNGALFGVDLGIQLGIPSK